MKRVGLGVMVMILWSQFANAQFGQQGAKLVGAGANGLASQGRSVAVSNDGNTAVVGGYLDGESAGAAWVFTRSGGAWAQQGTKLVGTSPTGSAGQGFSVAISGDGNTVILGGPGDNKGVGAAWIFARSGDTWTQQGNKFSGGGATGHSSFGWSVGLSADGNTAIVGGPGDNSNVGAAWVYTRSNGSWRQHGNKLVGTGAVGPAWQGWSVAMSADGATAAVGGLHDDNDVGAVWTFSQSGGNWAQQGSKLVGASPAATFTISGDAAVAANFSQEPTCYKLTLRTDPGNGGTIAVATPGNCTGGYLQGTQVSLRATATSGWAFLGWTGSGGSLSSTSLTSTVFTMTGNATVTATFTQQLSCFSLAVASSPTTAGNVTVDTAQNCGTAFAGGTRISVTADPVNGWVFAGWSGTGGTFSDLAAETTTFTINNTATITATFTQEPPCEPFTAVASPSAGGAVAVSTAANCTGGYLQGTHVVMTATPASGWRFAGWSGSGGTFSSASLPTTTFVVTGAGNVAANFTQAPAPCYTLSASANPAGAGTVTVNTPPNCVGGYTPGTQISLSATSAPGWTFVEWSGSGGSFSSITGISVNALQGASLAISGDGNTLIVGGYISSHTPRTVWVFARSAGAWSQQGAALATTGEAGGAQQAWSVSVSGDGNTTVVAEPGDNYGTGGAWVFARSGSSWAQAGSELVGAGATGAAGQGASVGLSADAGTIVLGGPNDAGGAGAIWAFAQGAAPACSFGLAPASQGVAARGGTGAFGVSVLSGTGCPWVALSNAPWIALTGGAAGTDAGQVKFAANGNPGNARVGTISVAGQTFTIYQGGADCSYQLSPTGQDFPTSGGATSFSVTAPANCPWTATSTAPWLHVTGGAAGAGAGSVNVGVDANTGAQRSGAIIVQDQSFAVTQANGLPPVAAEFTFAPPEPVIGETVQFTDASTGSPTSWSWDFGDGTASSVQNPTHAYAAADTYTVSLTVVNVNAPSTITHQVTVGAGVVVWVPVASHVPGVAGSVWLSDLGVLNAGTSSANVQVRLHTPAGVLATARDVAAASQAVLTDIVGQLGFAGSGAIEVRSDHPVVVTERTYNQSGNGTLGQDYSSYDSASTLGNGGSALLAQLVENAAYRTNILVTNTGAAPATVTVTLLDGDGNVLASYDVALAPGEWKQENRPFRLKASQTQLDRGYARVTVTSGSGVIASASVIDNLTNDPTTVAMAAVPGASGAMSLWIPVASHTLGSHSSVWLSDLGMLNPGAATAHVDVRLYTSGGVLTTSADVPADSQAVMADIVGALGFVGSGAIEVRSDQPIVVTSRTYNQSASGTLGQDYTSYASAAAIGNGQSAVLPQLTENAAYRSNISLTNIGTEPASVTVTLLDGAGATLASYDVTLAPGEWSQVNRPFFVKANQTAMDRGYATVTVTSGSGVVASASVIDNLSNAPTTAAMVQ